MTAALAERLMAWLRNSRADLRETAGPGAAPADIAAFAESVRDRLRSAGVQPHEPVQLTIANRATDIGVMLGIWLAGAVAVPIHHAASPTTREAIGRATGARFQLDGLTITRLADHAPRPRDLLASAALIVFTSGTTGVPKGVVLGHDALAGKIEALDRLLSFRQDDVVVMPLQLIFIFGIWVSLLAIRSGATLVLVQKFSPETVEDLLAHEATILAAVPSMLRVMAARALPRAARLRMVLTGGESLGPALKETLDDAWPDAGVFDLYGSTETGSCDFCLPPWRETGAGTIGYPTENVAFRIVRDDGTVAAIGETGELQIRTPYGMLGYLDNPAMTSAAFDGDHYRSGDLARLRPDGCTELVGRLKEIVSRGGNKISPMEIETVLCRHQDVAAALCAGVPDARYGEAIHAVVVPKPGTCLTPDALKRWAGTQMERFKVPDVVVFSETLPVGPTGKASRAGVRQLTASLSG
ncbi:class I adenylate-forming enzyme family protein [Methylobacterium nodulans]|uniref:AMP-dependent synthetase and ligase n=1 Tax=Methylobacterium nodulans (strain LMG 21967 / CNCM I-2342 / ORS 2060) TaxID=460265 RepID=B8IGD5_METNO|nr:fatty acid--CoA ligase family protein [Methylobacterium nodulans]ACL55835.1 AMP-dependent synthetase and ligase [Methylobacterium nodulans ORS 2060]